MAYTILSIGVDIPSYDIERIKFSEKRSLLDSDIVLFWTRFGIFTGREKHKGKPLLNANESGRLHEARKFWKDELLSALQHEKTVFIFLFEPQELFFQSKTYKDPDDYLEISSYSHLPYQPTNLIIHKGTKIKANKDLGVLAPFWAEFMNVFSYEVTFEDERISDVLVVPNTNRCLGGVFQDDNWNMVFLPALDLPDDFTDEDDSGKSTWNQKAVQFGKRFIASIIEIHKAIKSSRERTPPPEWVKAVSYLLDGEQVLLENSEKLLSDIKIKEQEYSQNKEQLENIGLLRDLLFEKGKPLERAIIQALEILGFSAEQYDDGESEFDAIFSAEEGEFLGEAEGRDTKAISIIKLSQLERNIDEDYNRDGVTVEKLGVLFGNAFRLEPPENRDEFFTAKCLKGAERSGVSLVRTTDLFPVVQYLKKKADKVFAQECRKAIIDGAGKVVTFPDIPHA
ncbi:MAG: hypothetical protein E3J72_14315 [Planctomycetota bacterium]|nr:MAG: hypothetical protein E3J72_14315 [Planctomycetota bacterium]